MDDRLIAHNYPLLPFRVQLRELMLWLARGLSGQIGLQDWGFAWTGHAFTRRYGECAFWMCLAGRSDLS